MPSIIIPFHNEAENAADVIDEVRAVLGPEAEILAVDDGSTDGTGKILAQIEGIRIVTIPERGGQSMATWRGLEAATHDICVIIDGDGQSVTQEIPTMLSYFDGPDAVDAVFTYRIDRQDSMIKKTSSFFANSVRRMALGDTARDAGSMKAIRKSHMGHLVIFDGFHRYIPSFIAAAGIQSIEIPVSHRPRAKGASKYGYIKRGLNHIRDIVKVRKMISAKKYE